MEMTFSMVNAKTGIFVGIAIVVCVGIAFATSYSLMEYV